MRPVVIRGVPAASGAPAPRWFARWMIPCVVWVASAVPSACILDLDLDPDGPRTRVNGSGHVVTETRTVSAFSRVSARGAGRIILEPADTEFVEVRADDNLLPILRTWVRDGTLFVGPDEGTNIDRVTEMVYTVGYVQLNQVGISGAMEGEALAIDTDFFTVDVSGASSFRTAGRAFDHDVRVSGASMYHAGELETSLAVVSASGASSAVVWVLDELDASASGASLIRYRGNPSIRASTSGAGTVTRY